MTLLEDLPAKRQTAAFSLVILRSFPQTSCPSLLEVTCFSPEQLVLSSASGEMLDKTHDTQG